MGPTGVVEADPFSDDTRGVLLGFEAMTMDALLFQRPDDALDHAVLLWAMRRDELLPETITAHEARVGPRGKNEPIIRPQKERGCDTSERPDPLRSTPVRAPTSPWSLYRFLRAASRAVLACDSRLQEPSSASHHGPPRRGRDLSPSVRSASWRPTGAPRSVVDARWLLPALELEDPLTVFLLNCSKLATVR